ncbi:MAG: HD domain-containing protein [Pirellulaceae bacterium]
MKSSKLRRQITWHAAMLMYQRQETEYYQAKMKAARTIAKGWVKASDLPSNREIRDEVQSFARMYEGESRGCQLQDMRVSACRMMRLFQHYHPRLIGSVLTGRIRSGSDIDIHLFADNLGAITGLLEYEGLRYDVECKQIHKANESRIFKHVHVVDTFDFELTVYPEYQRKDVMKSSITGKAIQRATLPELEIFMNQEYPHLNLEDAIMDSANAVDVFAEFRSLMLPLENVIQNPVYHPEGDALYHSLQVYDLACNARGYDEEFLLAALLHDVGKAIDPTDHVAAGIEALEEFVTERTLWLVEHHMFAHQLHDRTIGARARRRLEANENFDDLVLLGECDRGGRVQGIQTTDLDDALEYIRTLSAKA